jgi:hypothetical protein
MLFRTHKRDACIDALPEPPHASSAQARAIDSSGITACSVSGKCILLSGYGVHAAIIIALQ